MDFLDILNEQMTKKDRRRERARLHRAAITTLGERSLTADRSPPPKPHNVGQEVIHTRWGNFTFNTEITVVRFRPLWWSLSAEELYEIYRRTKPRKLPAGRTTPQPHQPSI